MDTFTVHEIAQLAEQRGYPAFASELYRIAASQALTDDGAKVLREKADHVGQVESSIDRTLGIPGD